MSNQVYANQIVKYTDGIFLPIIAKLPQAPQQFIFNLSGPFPSLLITMSYVISDKKVSFAFVAGVATTNVGTSTSIVSSNPLPVNIRPTAAKIFPFPIIIGTAGIEIGYLQIDPSGIISIIRASTVPQYPNGQNVGVSSTEILYTIP